MEHPRIDDLTRESLGTPITHEELFESLNSMANNKTPGIDGLSVNFYKKFWEVISPYYFAAVKEGLKQGMLHITVRIG